MRLSADEADFMRLSADEADFVRLSTAATDLVTRFAAGPSPAALRCRLPCAHRRTGTPSRASSALACPTVNSP